MIAKLPPHIRVIKREKIIEHPYQEPISPLEKELMSEYGYRIQYIIT